MLPSPRPPAAASTNTVQRGISVARATVTARGALPGGSLRGCCGRSLRCGAGNDGAGAAALGGGGGPYFGADGGAAPVCVAAGVPSRQDNCERYHCLHHSAHPRATTSSRRHWRHYHPRNGVGYAGGRSIAPTTAYLYGTLRAAPPHYFRLGGRFTPPAQAGNCPCHYCLLCFAEWRHLDRPSNTAKITAIPRPLAEFKALLSAPGRVCVVKSIDHFAAVLAIIALDVPFVQHWGKKRHDRASAIEYREPLH